MGILPVASLGSFTLRCPVCHDDVGHFVHMWAVSTTDFRVQCPSCGGQHVRRSSGAVVEVIHEAAPRPNAKKKSRLVWAR